MKADSSEDYEPPAGETKSIAEIETEKRKKEEYNEAVRKLKEGRSIHEGATCVNPNTAWLREVKVVDLFVFLFKLLGATLLASLVLAIPVFVIVSVIAQSASRPNALQ